MSQAASQNNVLTLMCGGTYPKAVPSGLQTAASLDLPGVTLHHVSQHNWYLQRFARVCPSLTVGAGVGVA
jgi:hypothetical protein